MNGFIIKPAGIERMQREIAAVLHLDVAQPSTTQVQANDDALLDHEQIAELAATLTPDVWQGIVASLAESAEQEIARIEAALLAGESPARAAQPLKGMAWNIGAARLGALAKRLETAAPDEATRLADELHVVLQETLTALERCIPLAAGA